MQEKKLRAAIVNPEGKVVNVIMWCPVRSKGFKVPDGHTLVVHNQADKDDFWDHEKKELHKVCRVVECKDKSHNSSRPHTHAVHQDHKEDQW